MQKGAISLSQILVHLLILHVTRVQINYSQFNSLPTLPQFNSVASPNLLGEIKTQQVSAPLLKMYMLKLFTGGRIALKYH